MTTMKQTEYFFPLAEESWGEKGVSVLLRQDPSGSKSMSLRQELMIKRSPLSPPYVISAILELAKELKLSSHSNLVLVRTIVDGESPKIYFDLPKSECIFLISHFVKEQGWGGLPVPVAFAIIQQAAKGLAHLHALGFTHGGLNASSIQVCYSGEVKLSGWAEGAVKQNSVEGQEYGRGPAADCRALLLLFEGLLTGQLSKDWNIGAGLAGHQAYMHGDRLPAQLIEWFNQQLQSVHYTHAGELNVALVNLAHSLEQEAFDDASLGRWLKRLMPQRHLAWNEIPKKGERALKFIFPNLGSMQRRKLFKKDNIADTRLKEQVPVVVDQVEQPVVTGDRKRSTTIDQSDGATTADQSDTPNSRQTNHSTAHHRNHQITRAKSSALTTITSDNNRSVNVPSTTTNAQSDADAQPHTKNPKSTHGSKYKELLDRIDLLLNQSEEWINKRISSRFIRRNAEKNIRVVTLWNDTVTSTTLHSKSTPIYVGHSSKNAIFIPLSESSAEDVLLCTSSQDGDLNVFVPQGMSGWCSHTNSQKVRIHAGQQVTLKQGDTTLINKGNIGVYIQYLNTHEIAPNKQLQFRWPVPQKNALGIYCIALAALLHLILLTMAYASKSYTINKKSFVETNRFVQVMIDPVKSTPIEEEEEDEDEEEDEEEEVAQVQEAPADSDVVSKKDFSEPPALRIKEQIKQSAKQRFGEGASAVDAISSFLEGKGNDSDKLSLGDATAALGSQDGMGIGDAFGNVGGDIQLAGGSGRLKTGGKITGARGAGTLKAKKSGRALKGRVRSLKRRVRVKGGALSKSQISDVINKNFRKIQACYERSMMKSGAVSGKLTVAWTITKVGKVKGVKQRTSTLGNPKLVSCIFKVIKKLKFPKPKGGAVKITYPFIFQQN